MTADIEAQIGEWREYLRRRGAFRDPDIAELEGHLRDQMEALVRSGLDEDEAFLVAVKRMGGLDPLSREFAKEHSERLWKQLVVGADDGESKKRGALEFRVICVLAFLAAVMIKVPELFGIYLVEENAGFYLRNASFFAWPLIAGFFLWKRAKDEPLGAEQLRPGRRSIVLAAVFAAAAFVNLYPFLPQSSTALLVAIHLPIALWLLVGIAYAGGRWGTNAGRMDFVRFSGELVIYTVLILCGGLVLSGFTVGIFAAIGLQVNELIPRYLFPCGTAAAPIVAAWLVETKKSVIENMAPVLAQIFTPLFVIVMMAVLGAMVVTGQGISDDRDALIAFDVMLALVLGLLLYSVSARPNDQPPGWPDRLQLILIGSALVIDSVALWGIASRISTFGWSPNRVAALGENLILLGNLVWSAVLYGRLLARREGFAPIERWQTRCLPLYSAWAAFVVIVFPLLFRFA